MDFIEGLPRSHGNDTILVVIDRFTKYAHLFRLSHPYDAPQGLIHFKYSMGSKNATFLTSLNSQNLGVIMIPNTIFASDPSILDDVLAKGFQLDKKMIKQLRKKFS
ncbi:putative germin-like protein 2-2 [Nicotiana sylvestris]|uniref:putative germin-like protein 2-2 n=1 Tax=Nicotiana sylvestris TaxID=4096 RepID=UPI00388C9374